MVKLALSTSGLFGLGEKDMMEWEIIVNTAADY